MKIRNVIFSGLFVCVLFFAGCSSSIETSVSLNLDISGLFDGIASRGPTVGAMPIFVTATVKPTDIAKENAGNVYTDTKNVNYPGNPLVSFEFESLDVGTEYSVEVVIKNEDTPLASGRAISTLTAGNNVIPISLSRAALPLSVTVDLENDYVDYNGVEEYLLYKLESDAHSEYKIEKAEKKKLSSDFSGFRLTKFARKVSVQAFFILSENTIAPGKKDDINDLRFVTLKQSDKKTLTIWSKRNALELELGDVPNSSSDIGVGVLAEPKIKVEASGCTIKESDPYEVKLTPAAPKITFSVFKKTDNSPYPNTATYLWYLNGVKQDFAPVAEAVLNQIPIELAVNAAVKPANQLNTMMVIVKAGGEMRSALWRFKIVD